MGANPLLVFRRELRGYFLSPIAYIVIAVFLVVTGWFFFSPFFLNDRADLREFFSLLPFILSFVIPKLSGLAVMAITSDSTSVTTSMAMAIPKARS